LLRWWRALARLAELQRFQGGVQVWVAVDEAAVHSGRPGDRRDGDDRTFGA
jgi:hypothetical protein